MSETPGQTHDPFTQLGLSGAPLQPEGQVGAALPRHEEEPASSGGSHAISGCAGHSHVPFMHVADIEVLAPPHVVNEHCGADVNMQRDPTVPLELALLQAIRSAEPSRVAI
jgi:hypothetical protein